MRSSALLLPLLFGEQERDLQPHAQGRCPERVNCVAVEWKPDIDRLESQPHDASNAAALVASWPRELRRFGVEISRGFKSRALAKVTVHLSDVSSSG